MGFFVVFEGLDGSGSSTQAQLLERHFKLKNRAVMMTKEPTNNLIGGLVRAQLTHEWKSSMKCLQLLFAADRAHHLERGIEPALKKNFVVISDRYKLSTISFGSLETDKEWLTKINEKFREPDLTILLKVSPDSCIKRMKNRPSVELFEEKNKLEKVWKAYESFADDKVVIVDGEKDIDEIHEEVVRLVTEKIKEHEIATLL
ncbi:MAG: dTMP kinase [Candidatus Aenigmarchaeota archaeon]|nr:dTMP kinase [Candidatus Aenigmarchaeota archaeon]